MNTILRLFYDLNVYREIIHHPFSKSIQRFLLTFLLLSGAYVFYLSRQPIPQVIQTIQVTLADITATIPDQATLTLADYRLSTTNLSLPYVLSDYLYLDPTSDTRALATASALVAAGSTHVRFVSDANTYEIRSYQDLGLNDLTITGSQLKADLTDLSHRITQITPYLPLILLFPVYLGLVIARLFYALFYAIIFYLITYLFKGGYRLGEFFKIALHVTLVAEILNLAVLFVYGPGFPIVFSLGFIGVSILAYLNLPARLKL